jgi:hypothetical protein
MSSLYRNYSVPSPSTHIRLTVLRPSFFREAPLECQIFVVPVDKTPDHTALSYTWGEAIFDQIIIA